ncbi:bifunctional ornithine acetyltransferase/N-acetylglutamate synthase [Aeribacillus sp. FSL K6-1121]|uniref:bifunctional ornithine acetyltransferase/N-acetylglutamate synthase n=1 Tax=Aeribacillus TaxID=1055323 RepID=UPI0010232A73|nr:bifunctional ornithine acetyltransferase/N-acetylglutamate synthase [Aeribacillus pallidus]RZI50424.1 bifunctional ornithine acetyltransferase/N-acetylglutamate synthase [Aeribacillus pallidus]BBU38746.1 arginine biosynthesis bifunctional protein ArgJ [Aeribacillus pallidus]
MTTKIRKIDNGSITTPKGFYAGGYEAHIRYTHKKDIGIIYSDVSATAAAVYTQNVVQAAPIFVTKESIAKENKIQAVIVNSGNANACTGEKGLSDAYAMRKWTAEKLGIADHLVAVASTGVIGEYLNMEKVQEGINNIEYERSSAGAKSFAEAILTTDTCEKTACYQFEIEGKQVTIGGAAKGSGMIHPNMATMLGFLTTDANINEKSLQQAFREVIDETFNQITVDGDTSTNDMVLVLANGKAEHSMLTEEHPDWPVFKEALRKVSEDLAKQIARDGEGATKLIEVSVNGAKSKQEANIIAKTIVGSSLVKTAIYGKDANWGRILCAAGYSGAEFDPNQMEVYLGHILLFKNGLPVSFSEQEAIQYLDQEIVEIKVMLNNGEAQGKAWGCDLTYEYVKINASYRT